MGGSATGESSGRGAARRLRRRQIVAAAPSARCVLKSQLVVLHPPPQINRPAAWCREINDGRSRTAGDSTTRRSVRAGQPGPDLQRPHRADPCHPEDLVVPVCGRRYHQGVVVSPEHGHNVASVAHDVGHRGRRWAEARPGPRRKGPRGIMPTATLSVAGRRRRSRGVETLAGSARVTGRPLGRAPGQCQQGKQAQDRGPSHSPTLRPY